MILLHAQMQLMVTGHAVAPCSVIHADKTLSHQPHVHAPSSNPGEVVCCTRPTVSAFQRLGSFSRGCDHS